jgi:hypothetical protein
LLALAAAPALAEPTVGPQIRIDVAGGTFAANETTVSMSPAHPDRIVAGWNDWRHSPTVQNEVIRAGIALSLNGGQSWTDFVVRPPAPFQSGVEGDPMTAADPRTGALWVGAISFSGNGGLYVARLDPGETSFEPSVMADTGSVDKCWMVAGRNHTTPNSTRLYITYDVGVVRSDDMGDSWSVPVSLGPGVGFLPRIGPGGEVYVAYWDWSQERFEVKRSLDGGVSFTTHNVATRMDTWGVETFNTRFPGTFRVAPLLGLAVDPNDGTLYGVWPDTTDMSQNGQPNVDVYFSKSTDQGTTWATPKIINGEGPFVGDQFFPWIEVDPTGRLHVLYLDSRHTQQSDTAVSGLLDAYYSYSEDGGETFSEIRLTPESWDSANDGLARNEQFIGDYVGMTVTETEAWPVYPASHNGDTDTYTHKIDFCVQIGEVDGLLLGLSPDGSEIHFQWTDAPGATDYVVFQDFAASGPFFVPVDTATSGVIGATVSTPLLNRYYLVAGRNSCGVGPK